MIEAVRNGIVDLSTSNEQQRKKETGTNSFPDYLFSNLQTPSPLCGKEITASKGDSSDTASKQSTQKSKIQKVSSSRLESSHTVQLENYNKTIIEFLNENKPDRALNVLRNIIRAGLEPNETSYITFLNYYLKQNQEKEALRFLKNIENIPDWSKSTYPYMLMMEFYCKEKNEKIFQILKRMNQHHVVFDERVYNTLLNFYVRLNNKVEAYKILNEMLRLDLKVNIKDYTTIMKLHLYDKSDKEILSLIDQMESHNTSMDIFAFNALIHHYLNNDNIDKAKGIRKRMKISGIKPNEVTYSFFIDFFVRTEKFEVASLYINKRLIHKKQLKVNQQGQFDVHGLSHGTAFILLRNLLNSPFQNLKFPVKVVTGKGIHSRQEKMFNMRNYIADKIAKYLPKYTCKADSRNEGLLYIYPAVESSVKSVPVKPVIPLSLEESEEPTVLQLNPQPQEPVKSDKHKRTRKKRTKKTPWASNRSHSVKKPDHLLRNFAIACTISLTIGVGVMLFNKQIEFNKFV